MKQIAYSEFNYLDKSILNLEISFTFSRFLTNSIRAFDFFVGHLANSQQPKNLSATSS